MCACVPSVSHAGALPAARAGERASANSTYLYVNRSMPSRPENSEPQTDQSVERFANRSNRDAEQRTANRSRRGAIRKQITTSRRTANSKRIASRQQPAHRPHRTDRPPASPASPAPTARPPDRTARTARTARSASLVASIAVAWGAIGDPLADQNVMRAVRFGDPLADQNLIRNAHRAPLGAGAKNCPRRACGRG